MSVEIITTLCFAFVLIMILTSRVFWRARKYPPGPIGIPFFGNLFSIRDRPPIRLMELAQKYGPIFSVRMGSQLVVVLDEPNLIKEGLGLEPFLYRPDSVPFSVASGGKFGLSFSEGQSWKEQRRFALQQMTGLGIRSLAMTNLILDEVVEFCDWMESEEGQPISIHRKLGLYVLNSLWTIVGGTRFRPDDPYLLQIADQQSKDVSESIAALMVFAHPKLALKFPKLFGWDKLQNTLKPLKTFIEKLIQDHISLLPPPTPKDGEGHQHLQRHDFISAYLQKMKDTTDENSSFYGGHGYSSLCATLMDFYAAGSESTSNVLTWAILYMTTHEKCQRKLQAEIDRVIGKARLPTLTDKPMMPYSQAVLNEVIRVAAITSLTLFRAAKKDVEFHGYLIPKGTYLTANIHSVHHNARIWGDPAVFRPERFLTCDESQVVKRDELLGFGAGPRRCIGEGWSMDALFLFIVTIFQRFHLCPVGTPSLEPDFSLTATSKPFKLTAHQRAA